MAYGFGHLWQQDDLSDAEIVISVQPETNPTSSDASKAGTAPITLQQFPGHTQVLSISPYFRAQALRWSTHPQSQDSSTSTSDTAGSLDQAGRRQIPITLPDASYQPAALAVLAGLYAVKSWSKLFDPLTPQQHVQAAVLADMWELPTATNTFLQCLQDATLFDDDWLTAVLEQLLAMAAVPDCLQTLLESALLYKFDDLEAVWGAGAASSELQASLLALPLPAMELLLSSNDLRVASEDTVLYTAQAYVDAQPAGHARQLAQDTLAPLVRCPKLSYLWLSASVLADDAGEQLLNGLQPQLKKLLLLQPVCNRHMGLEFADIKEFVPDKRKKERKIRCTLQLAAA